MRSVFYFFSLLFIFSFCSGDLYAQAQLTASIKPTHLTTDEYATLRFELKGQGNFDQFSPPDLKGFEIVSGPNQESSMSSINGVVTQYTALNYIIRPRTAGRYSIGSATVISTSQKLRSNPVTLTVDKGTGKPPAQAQPPASPLSSLFSFDDPEPQTQSVDLNDYILHKGENVAAKVDKNMALRLETNKTECYVGEPILATYKFYTRLKSESRLTKNPSFNGFSVVDMQGSDVNQSTISRLNGRDYNAYVIRKSQLYPLQAGTITLESATIDNDIQFLKEDGVQNGSVLRDLRNGFPLSPEAQITQHVSLSSKPVSITVKPLPEAGKPAFFHGAVGNFRIEGVFQKNNFSTDETGSLKITITGAGNLQLITAPEINWPEGIDAFDPVLVDNIDETQYPISGSKTFTYNFSVNHAGKFQIPAVAFAFFDPQAAVYKTVQTPTQELNISKGRNPVRSLHPVAPETKKDLSFTTLLSEYWPWFAGGLVFLIIIIFALSKSRKKTAPIIQQEKTLTTDLQEKSNLVAEKNIEDQKNPLSQTELCLAKNDCNNFYAVLNKELRNFLGNKLGIAPTLINKYNLEQLLDKCNIETPVTLELGHLLEEIEWNLYSPVAPGEHLQTVYKKSIELVQTITEKCRKGEES